MEVNTSEHPRQTSRDVIINIQTDITQLFQRILHLCVQQTLKYRHPLGIMKGYVKFTFGTKWSCPAGQCARTDLKKHL